MSENNIIETPSQAPHLKRSLSFIDILCLGINAIVGSGIFLFPGKLAKEVGAASIFAFLVCGLLLITVALCYAELGSMFGRNGAAYVYARESFGPVIGFGVGWMAWVTAVFSWATVANGISTYLAYFDPIFEESSMIKVAACGLILFFGIINYFGIKPGAMIVNLFTISKLLPLTLFVVLGLPHLNGGHFSQALEIDYTHFGAAIFLCLWPLQGFETVPVAAGETRNPSKDVPLATIGSLLFAIIFYTLIQVVAVGTLAGLAQAEKPLADAAATFMGSWGASFLALGAVISMTGYCSGNALGSPRFLQALAEDRCLPTSLSDPHPQYQTPWRSILLTTGVASIMAFTLNFESLVDLSTMAVISQYLSTCIGVIWLRYRQPQLERPFKMPLGYFIPVIGCLISFWLIQQVKGPEVVFSVLTLIVGFIFWGVYNFYSRSKA